MKKILSLTLSLMLLLGILAVPAMAEEAQQKIGGQLSYLAMTEEEDLTISAPAWRPLLKLLNLRGVLVKGSEDPTAKTTSKFYDSLSAMLMGLQSGEVNDIKLPYYTAKYLCSTNEGLKLLEEYHPEKADTEIVEWAISRLSDGYSFMLKEENTELRDAFDEQITAMKEDGTLQELIDEHIIKVSEGGEPVAIAFEQFEGDPIKVGVTGDLPPMDYVAPDGTFAGFNTAVLAEIGRRLQKNIELVQVENVGRALALSEGVVDVVFWTRGMSGTMVTEFRLLGTEPSEEEREAKRAERREKMTDEEKALIPEEVTPDDAKRLKMDARDMPAGTIVTQPYFSDFPVLVTLK